MFANIRRHQKWLWILISGAVIISFVWYFNPNSRYGGGGGGGRGENSVGKINGRKISRGEYYDAEREAHLRYFMNYQSWYGTDEFSRQNEGFIEHETRNRLILKEKLKEYNVHVSDAEVAEWIRGLFGPDHPFTPADFDRFVKSQLEPHQIRETDFERFGRTELGIQHLISVAGLPGKLVTPQEAETQYRRENQQVQAQIVTFSASNFLAKVNLDTNALLTFYTNRQAQYRINEKVALSYVEFPASNYFAIADQKLTVVTNLAQRVEETYQQRGAQFYTDTNGAVLPPEAAKQKIREDFRTSLALVEAQRAATDFAEELLNMPSPKQISNLTTLAAKKGIPVKDTQPFEKFESPRGMEVTERFSQTAFNLTPAEPFVEEPIRGSDAVYVAGLKERYPSEIPSFERVRDRVVEDFKADESRKMAFNEAVIFHAHLTNTVASGKPFEAAAAEFGGHPVKLKPFAQNARTIDGLDPRIDPSTVRSIAFNLKEGETGNVTPTRDGALIVHVDKFIPVSDADVKAGLPAYMATLQRQGLVEAFQEWFGKQAQTVNLTLVTDKSQEGAASGKQ
jgi:hypothetical protein